MEREIYLGRASAVLVLLPSPSFLLGLTGRTKYNIGIIDGTIFTFMLIHDRLKRHRRKVSLTSQPPRRHKGRIPLPRTSLSIFPPPLHY